MFYCINKIVGNPNKPFKEYCTMLVVKSVFKGLLLLFLVFFLVLKKNCLTYPRSLEQYLFFCIYNY